MTAPTDGLRLERVTKRFGEVTALRDVDLSVLEGEFVSLLGPSGCGKTTLLRIVAGFERPTRGRVLLDGHDITYWPPYKRPVNTVFQRSVLFPHLSVFENIAFGLRLARLPKDEIRSRTRGALSLVRLPGFESRRSNELSGGQAQRVNLARALVNRPRLLTLDEPLTALDLKVRSDMQAELRRIHRETGTTFLYVTHDQQEAMSMSDRVIVMSEGAIEQVGPPSEIYHRPATRFVAGFVGDANLLRARVLSTGTYGSTVCVQGTDHKLQLTSPTPGREGWVVLRPEVLRLVSPGEGMFDGIVADGGFLGSSVIYRVNIGGLELRVQELGEDVEARFAIGEAVGVDYKPERCSFLPDPGADQTLAEASEAVEVT